MTAFEDAERYRFNEMTERRMGGPGAHRCHECGTVIIVGNGRGGVPYWAHAGYPPYPHPVVGSPDLPSEPPADANTDFATTVKDVAREFYTFDSADDANRSEWDDAALDVRRRYLEEASRTYRVIYASGRRIVPADEHRTLRDPK